MNILLKGHSLFLFLFFVLSLLLCTIFFFGLGKNDFIYMGDQLLRFNFFDSFSNAYTIRKWEHFGVHNGWQFTVQFWDASFYSLFYLFSLPVQFVERLHFLLVLFVSLSFSYFGFVSWGKFLQHKFVNPSAAVITLWYCFNPYAVMLWHGGVFNLSLAVTYSLAPLLFLQLYKSLFIERDFKSLFLLVVLIAASFFVFWLFAPLMLFFFLFYFICALVYVRKIKQVFVRSVFFLLLTFIITSPILFAVTHEMFSNTVDMNSTYSPTFGNQQGGLLYMFLFLFSWGIYTIWTPRAMYPFFSFYFSQQYLWGIILMYVGIITGGLWFYYRLIKHMVKKTLKQSIVRDGLFFLFFIFMFVASIFLAKGAQEPYGWLFIYLFENVPFFSVFRTPDIRFGFTVVLSVSLMMLFFSRFVQRVLFTVLVVVLLLLQSSIFFSGAAVRGENIQGKFYDRVVTLPDSYIHVRNFINNRDREISYVFTYPSYENGIYKIDDDYFVGQDILSRIVEKPFVYLSETTGIAKNSYAVLKSILENKEYVKLADMPIQYFIIRRDVDCPSCFEIDKKEFEKYFDLKLTNNDFDLYEAKNYSRIISGSISGFEVWSPTTYIAQLENKDLYSDIILTQSYNENWSVYSLPAEFPKFLLSILVHTPIPTFLFTEISNDTHIPFTGYANKWITDPEVVLSDEVLIVYKPQLWYSFLFWISGSTILSGLGYLLTKKKLRRFT